MPDTNKLYMMKKNLIILIFLTLGTLLALLLSYYGWEDVYIRLQHHEKISMYEPLLLASYADFTLLSIMGCISIMSVLRKGKIWVPIIKCIIVNVGLWMVLALVISVIVFTYEQLPGIILIGVFGSILWGLFKIWEVTNVLRSECESKGEILSQKGLNRYIDAQEDNYNVALEEIRAGKKENHWIWYVFPQMKGLGHSHFANLYGIVDVTEAREYLKNDILAFRLREVTTALLEIDGLSAENIFGELDAMKVKSSLTLFDLVSPNDIFAETLNKYFEGKRCELTLRLIAENEKLNKREAFNWKRFLKKPLVVIITLVSIATLVTLLIQNTSDGDVFKCVDTRLGIEAIDYRVVRQSYHIHGFQDPSMVQKIKLNSRGRTKIEEYMAIYQDTLNALDRYPDNVYESYRPVLNYSKAHLDNGLSDRDRLEIYGEILEDTEDAYVRMQTSQVGRYFEQFCWLGGDYWKIIIDRKRGIIYREYGSI